MSEGTHGLGIISALLTAGVFFLTQNPISFVVLMENSQNIGMMRYININYAADTESAIESVYGFHFTAIFPNTFD